MDRWSAALIDVPAKPGKEERTVWLLVDPEPHPTLASSAPTSVTTSPVLALLSALIDAMVEPKEGAVRRPAAVETGPNLVWDPGRADARTNRAWPSDPPRADCSSSTVAFPIRFEVQGWLPPQRGPN